VQIRLKLIPNQNIIRYCSGGSRTAKSALQPGGYASTGSGRTAAQLRIVFGQTDNPLVSITLLEVSLPEAIQRIASADDLIFYHGQNSTGQSTIQLVKTYPRTEVPLQPSIRYIGSGVITKTGDDSGESPK
jgi:hypothetical protein